MGVLEKSAVEVESRTRKTFEHNKKDGPSPNQIMEGQRVLEVVTACLEEMHVNGVGGLHVQGEPIIVLDVQVNKNLRQAKVFWALPYGILLDEKNISKSLYLQAMSRMEERVHAEGKLLQRNVHSRLRSYYPPQLRFFRATDMMILKAIEELMDYEQ
jgi:ribosome-binding factor A